MFKIDCELIKFVGWLIKTSNWQLKIEIFVSTDQSCWFLDIKSKTVLSIFDKIHLLSMLNVFLSITQIVRLALVDIRKIACFSIISVKTIFSVSQSKIFFVDHDNKKVVLIVV